MKKILAFVGPTASGKTELSVEISKKFNGEIISCDSMQLYRGMNIGTAKPDEAEKRGIVHHMIDILDINDAFSVSDYVEMANRIYDDIVSRGKLAVFCGGTGLYIDSFISDVNFGDYEINPDVSKQLLCDLESCGAEALYDRLLSVDPTAAQKTCFQNVKRVMRALEVYYSTGITISEWNIRSLENSHHKDSLIIGLDYKDRNTLYDRIEMRVDSMIKAGLLEETERLIKSGLRNSPTAGQAIGYKEFYPYFDGQATLEECIETLKKNTRHYAKRQLTWFRRNPLVKWIYRDCMSQEEIFSLAQEMVNKYLSKEDTQHNELDV